jgi:tRNA A-37 threonylcarbamoyl transferase component Bud32
MHLAKNMIEILEYMKENEILHGDICAEQISINEEGVIQVIDQGILNTNSTNLHRVIYGEGGYIY